MTYIPNIPYQGTPMASVPAGSTNGTVIPETQVPACKIRFYLGNNDSVKLAIASVAPSAPPANTFTISGSGTGPNWDEELVGQQIYIISVSGTPQYRRL